MWNAPTVNIYCSPCFVQFEIRETCIYYCTSMLLTASFLLACSITLLWIQQKNVSFLVHWLPQRTIVPSFFFYLPPFFCLLYLHVIYVIYLVKGMSGYVWGVCRCTQVFTHRVSVHRWALVCTFVFRCMQVCMGLCWYVCGMIDEFSE